MSKKNFYIKTYGCQMNVNDSEKMNHLLLSSGFERTEQEENADIVIINSCAVREKSQDKIFSHAGRLKREQIIIVAGCVSQSERENILKRNHNIDYVVGTHSFYNIANIVNNLIKNKKKGLSVEFSREWKELIPSDFSRFDKVSGYVSIMEGCNNFCSYCIVPFTRGREKYRPYENILKEARDLEDKGFKEIILLGQNVNSWRDEEKGMKFHNLLEKLAGSLSVKWIRFITSYPGYYSREIIEVMKDYKNIARHIHFPAQSGSSRILKLMNRIYSAEEYIDIIENFKKHIPDIKFSSDFIVGFPQETENDFKKTLELVKRIEFESIFSFVYSPRKHTRAIDFEDNISLKEKKKRLYRLQELQAEIQLKNNKKLIGKDVEVLITDINKKKKGEVIARTESYRVVNFKSNIKPGNFTNVRVISAGPHSLRAEDK